MLYYKIIALYKNKWRYDLNAFSPIWGPPHSEIIGPQNWPNKGCEPTCWCDASYNAIIKGNRKHILGGGHTPATIDSTKEQHKKGGSSYNAPLHTNFINTSRLERYFEIITCWCLILIYNTMLIIHLIRSIIPDFIIIIYYVKISLPSK